MELEELQAHAQQINQQMARFGVKFGIYKNGVFNERLFPFDPIPRIIEADEFAYLEKGLIQRVNALNLFLADIYGEKNILKDKVVPEEFVYISPGYLAECEGVVPPKNIYSHISGIDLVKGKDGEWYILEDNLRIPSGASYPLIARELSRKVCPDTFRKNDVRDNRNYGKMLKEVMDYVNCGGINVILTPGRYNAAYFEHSFLAEKTNAVLAESSDLYAEDNCIYYRGDKMPTKVGAIYRRLSDEYMDPLCFNPESLIGVPNLMAAYRAGNVALINAPGNGVADDKGIYYFVPKMIEYYLHEEPILHNAPTFLLYYKEDRDYTLAHINELVIKDVAEAGGYGVVFGKNLSPEKQEELKALIQKEPRRFISQRVIDFQDLEIMGHTERKADLRAFVLTGGKNKGMAVRPHPFLSGSEGLYRKFFTRRRFQGHMGTLTLNKIDRLFWMGRYAERVNTSLHFMMTYYDKLIDSKPMPYQEVCQRLAIPDIYTSDEDFAYKYVFDRENPDSIIVAADRMLGNGMTLRETISSWTLSYLQMAVNSLQAASTSTSPSIEAQETIDAILAFRGSFDDNVEEQNVRNVTKCGFNVEKVSLYLRLGYPDEICIKEISKLIHRIQRTEVRTRSSSLAYLLQVSEKLPEDRSLVIKAAEELVEI